MLLFESMYIDQAGRTAAVHKWGLRCKPNGCVGGGGGGRGGASSYQAYLKFFVSNDFTS